MVKIHTFITLGILVVTLAAHAVNNKDCPFVSFIQVKEENPEVWKHIESGTKITLNEDNVVAKLIRSKDPNKKKIYKMFFPIKSNSVKLNPIVQAGSFYDNKEKKDIEPTIFSGRTHRDMLRWVTSLLENRNALLEGANVVEYFGKGTIYCNRTTRPCHLASWDSKEKLQNGDFSVVEKLTYTPRNIIHEEIESGILKHNFFRILKNRKIIS
jgi:hypothetical protein